MSSLNWNNLKFGDCPKCSVKLVEKKDQKGKKYLGCPAHECRFFVSEGKAAEICYNLNNKVSYGGRRDFGKDSEGFGQD